jgi:hydrogenase maturation protease
VTLSVAVLGIGNILMKDDGAGVRAVDLLRTRGLPGSVRLVDVGTTIYHTMGIFSEAQKLIVLDAVRLDNQPGTIYQFNAEEFRVRTPRKSSSHEIGVLDALALLSLSGQAIPEVVIIGVEPKEYGSWGEELSPEVSSAIPLMADKAVDQLRLWGAV